MTHDPSQPLRDPFYDIVPERMWLDVTNIGVRAEGMVRVVLRVNDQEKELYHSYVTDGIVSHGFNLTPWLHRAKSGSYYDRHYRGPGKQGDFIQGVLVGAGVALAISFLISLVFS